MYELDEVCFTTPNGNRAFFYARRGTTDWNTINSITTADEYGVAGLELSGYALDLGAHIGAMAIALAIDNPALSVIAVEPIPENAELVSRNAERNGLSDRVDVLQQAVGRAGETLTVNYGFVGDETAEHHAFIGNSTLVSEAVDHRSTTVPCFDLWALPWGSPSFVKIDCEGGEWEAIEPLIGLACPRIAGEWHPTDGHVRDDLVLPFVDAGYTVETTGPEAGPGGFTALL